MTFKDGVVIADRMDACYMCGNYDNCSFIQRNTGIEFNLTVVVQICCEED